MKSETESDDSEQRTKEAIDKIRNDYFESRALGLNEKNFGYWSGRMDGLGTALQALGVLDKDFKMSKSESELARLTPKELE